MVKVTVTVVRDGKKIFEQEGELFVGSAVLDSDENTVEAYTAIHGESDMNTAALVLENTVVETLKAVAENKVEYVAKMIKINRLLTEHIKEELKSEEFPQELARVIRIL